MRITFEPVPTKVIPDYDAIAAYVEKHGFMLLPLDLDGVAGYNGMHAVLHARFGLGMRQVRDPETHEHVGWRIAPARKYRMK